MSLLSQVHCISNTGDDVPTQVSDLLILEDGNLVDVIEGGIREEIDIVISGDSIIEIGPDVNKDRYDNAQVIDIEGKYIIPGLIEGHVHITPLPEKSLTFALIKGVVALRDMGGDGAYLKMLKEAIEKGDLKGPDLYYSALMGGHDLIMKDNRARLATPPSYKLGDAPWMRLVQEDSDVSRILLDARNCGATGIKMYAYLSDKLVGKLTEEAKHLGLKIWAHAVVNPATAEDVITAGVEVVSHGCFILLPPDWIFSDGSHTMDTSYLDLKRQTQLFAAMKDNGVALDPTILVTNVMLSSITNKEKVKELKESLYKAVGAAHDQGVRIIAGTDMPLPSQADERLALHEELELLVTRVGMSPIDALRAATIFNAEVLGIDNILGSIEIGKAASMVVITGNPMDNIRHIEKVSFVIKNGRLVY